MAILLAARAEFVPERDGPGLGVLARDLSDVFVLVRVAVGDFDDVATPGVTDVALICVDAAGAGGAGLAEAIGLGGVLTALFVRQRQAEWGKCCEEGKRSLELHFCENVSALKAGVYKNDGVECSMNVYDLRIKMAI